MGKVLEQLSGRKGALIIVKDATTLGTHSFDGGFLANVEDIKQQILNIKGQDGVTISGGDPMFQIEACNELAKFCKEHGLSVWCYTGFTFEELLKMKKTNQKLNEFLHNIDVLVDGKFVQDKKSLSLYFRGSTNQRIIDMPQSLKKGKPVEIQKYKYIPDVRQTLFGKTEFMFI